MALGHLATSCLVVACVLFRAPDVSQVHLEPDGIRFDLGHSSPEAIFCEPCTSAASECHLHSDCAEFLCKQEHQIAGASALIFLLVARMWLQVPSKHSFVQVDFGPRELERFSLTPTSTMTEGGLYLVERSGSFDKFFVCGETAESLWLCKC